MQQQQKSEPAKAWKAAGSRREIFLLMFLFILCCKPGAAQIAPGPLSPAHAFLGGITRCGACHNLLRSELKCLECHREIKRRIDGETGYHAHAYNKSIGTVDCARCHAEHRGPGSSLVPLDRKNFDHGYQTDFALEGKHATLQCEKCHSESKINASARSEIKIKDLNRSFLGLRRECTTCHREPHRNQLGPDCLSCHTPQTWKPASRFDHARSSFPLTGRHLTVSCEKCHIPISIAASVDNRNLSNVGSLPQRIFKGLEYGSCGSCHEDRHGGAFKNSEAGSRCERCHDTNGFNGNYAIENVDHSTAGFLLTGKHSEVPCGKCHKSGNFARSIAHKLCGDCHQDPHRGQFASKAGSLDCSKCHSTGGFKPALFKKETHARNAFPLEGRHAALPCLKCHNPELREILFKAGKRICSDCHLEPHGGEFASQPYTNRCDLCHTEEGFETTTFSRERHAETRFPLTGQHSKISCGNCHKPLPAVRKADTEMRASTRIAREGAASAARLQFHFSTRTCDVCHQDPHNLDPETNLSCNRCHTTQQWGILLPFDHSSVSNKLEGVHREAANKFKCVQCHKMREMISGTTIMSAPGFSEASIQCARCHASKDPHSGQFGLSANGERDCSSCHTPNSWELRSFDHSKTRFALTGPHRSVSCDQCHKNQAAADGRTVRWYRDTPSDCLKCH